MKISGAELQQFTDEAWPSPADDWYWDHDLFFDTPDPLATYETDDIGPVHFQGHGDDPTNGDGYNLATLIKKWRRERDCDVFTVLVPKPAKDAFLEALRAVGGSISRAGAKP
ncbi:hypothetical protein FJ951_26855 [Mesorhizobium sp. B2-2-3]|uniref:hypothetical protein n=1 Tax=Mesorhizobium sp. B2-2-3 TaxID=2589963 RepID=UPI00112ECEF5|nr:hypothetical protein [Mesorhizobium sp. B2-2-3]TPM39332.1 hypothetical protein FJ951_26855 [Mesorhizobium sp. B2-2-3]